MSAIPAAYRQLIFPLIDTARSFLENGEELAPVAFVGNFESGIAVPVLLDSGSMEAKESSARAIKALAEEYKADFVFLMMEAWSLRKDKLSQMDRILQRYGSIGASPYRVDIVAMSLETRHGVWMAEVPIEPMGDSKTKRTFGEPGFRLFKEFGGRFLDLLPRREGEAPAGTLH